MIRYGLICEIINFNLADENQWYCPNGLSQDETDLVWYAMANRNYLGTIVNQLLRKVW